MKFARASLTIRMRGPWERGWSCTACADQGPGIPEEIRKKIFQPFFTTRTDGTGMGLATCLKNVQYHGGTIDVSSETGHGARVLVTLPLLSRI